MNQTLEIVTALGPNAATAGVQPVVNEGFLNKFK